MIIQATSQAEEDEVYVSITIDGEPIEVAPNEDGHYRGLHVVVLHPNTGKIETARVFDATISSEAFDTFIDANETNEKM